MAKTQLRDTTLSLCMIVRDEAANLEACLESVRDVADEIIVVDTGSRDNTVELARQLGACVYTFDWCDDFAAARNEALRHATGKWVFQIDADERLAPESKPELKKWLRNRDVTCVNVVIDSPKREHKKGHISRAHRLFRNLVGVRYSGRIHEQISPSVQKIGGKEGFSTILLRHSGYALDEKEMGQKSARNRRLLEMQLQDEPNQPYWRFTLAQNLILSGELQEAEQHLNTALAQGGLPDDICCSIFNNLAEINLKFGKYREAIGFASKALQNYGGNATSHLLLVQIYGLLQDHENQCQALESAIAIAEKSGGKSAANSQEAYVDQVALYTGHGKLCLQLGKPAAAKISFDKALALAPENRPARTGQAEALLHNKSFSQALEAFEMLRQENPGDLQILDKIGWLAIKTGDFQRALGAYETLRSLCPENGNLLKRLAALHQRLGNQQESRALLQQANTLLTTEVDS